MKRTESLLNDRRVQLENKEHRIVTLESSIADKDKELATTVLLKDDYDALSKSIERQQEEFERQRETSVRGKKPI
jgi:predicted transcriptional regulator